MRVGVVLALAAGAIMVGSMGCAAGQPTTPTTQATQAAATRAAASPAKRMPFTLGPDTTRISGPVRADGTIDYVAACNALLGKGVTAENNAAPVALQAFGPGVLPAETRQRVLRELGLQDLPERGAYFVPIRDYAKAQGWGDGEEEAAALMVHLRRLTWNPQAGRHVAA